METSRGRLASWLPVVDNSAMNSPTEIDAPPPLRLSILHLLMWTTGSALLATYLRAFPADRFEGTLGAVLLGMQLTYAVIGGLGIASVGMLFQYGFHQNARFPREPGHWLLLATGVGILVGLIVRWTTFLVFAEEGNPLWRQRVFRAAVVVATMTVLGVGQASVRKPFWRWVFRLTLFYSGFLAVIAVILAGDTGRLSSTVDKMLLHAIRWYSMLLGIAMFFRLVYELLSTPRLHDWLHRIALCALVIAGCNSAAAYFILPLLQN